MHICKDFAQSTCIYAITHMFYATLIGKGSRRQHFVTQFARFDKVRRLKRPYCSEITLHHKCMV